MFALEEEDLIPFLASAILNLRLALAVMGITRGALLLGGWLPKWAITLVGSMVFMAASSRGVHVCCWVGSGDDRQRYFRQSRRWLFLSTILSVGLRWRSCPAESSSRRAWRSSHRRLGQPSLCNP